MKNYKKLMKLGAALTAAAMLGSVGTVALAAGEAEDDLLKKAGASETVTEQEETAPDQTSEAEGEIAEPETDEAEKTEPADQPEAAEDEVQGPAASEGEAQAPEDEDGDEPSGPPETAAPDVAETEADPEEEDAAFTLAAAQAEKPKDAYVYTTAGNAVTIDTNGSGFTLDEGTNTYNVTVKYTAPGATMVSLVAYVFNDKNIPDNADDEAENMPEVPAAPGDGGLGTFRAMEQYDTVADGEATFCLNAGEGGNQVEKGGVIAVLLGSDAPGAAPAAMVFTLNEDNKMHFESQTIPEDDIVYGDIVGNDRRVTPADVTAVYLMSKNVEGANGPWTAAQRKAADVASYPPDNRITPADVTQVYLASKQVLPDGKFPVERIPE